MLDNYVSDRKYIERSAVFCRPRLALALINLRIELNHRPKGIHVSIVSRARARASVCLVVARASEKRNQIQILIPWHLASI